MNNPLVKSIMHRYLSACFFYFFLYQCIPRIYVCVQPAACLTKCVFVCLCVCLPFRTITPTRSKPHQPPSLSTATAAATLSLRHTPDRAVRPRRAATATRAPSRRSNRTKCPRCIRAPAARTNWSSSHHLRKPPPPRPLPRSVILTFLRHQQRPRS